MPQKNYHSFCEQAGVKDEQMTNLAQGMTMATAHESEALWEHGHA
jgi:hypothetical protein